jgi:hypothetical protein
MVLYAEEPQAITEAYWSQILTLYSILVAAVISIGQTQLTKFHAIIAIELVASPLTFYVAIYAIRSMFGHKHRLDHLLGRGKVHYRMLALGTVALLIGFFIYVMIPAHLQQFSQASCDAKSMLVKLSFLLPVILFAGVIIEGGLIGGFTFGVISSGTAPADARTRVSGMFGAYHHTRIQKARKLNLLSGPQSEETFPLCTSQPYI